MNSRSDPGTFTALQLTVTGRVQGVGFRPHVYRQAKRFGIAGQVCNSAAGVEIFAQADAHRLSAFMAALSREAPALARITAVEQVEAGPQSGLQSFRILASVNEGGTGLQPTPDAATCEDCLQELFDPNNRRYRYPFINCTQCGPRYSLMRQLPYDRPVTAMADFQLCQSCRAEYEDPLDCRYHAQPNACVNCGPELLLYDARANPISCTDPVAEAVDRLRRGEILAIKGNGGMHLACDASNPAAVAALRQRKQRPDKPFALMAANLSSLQQWVDLSSAAATALRSSVAPVVLCPWLEPDKAPKGISPGLAWAGVMLPHNPLQHLLFYQAAGCPATPDWREQVQPLLLVMTSANLSGSPVISDNRQALEQLQGVADAFLLHNLAIEHPCDDSVISATGADLRWVRMGRGLAPQVVALGQTDTPSVLALGAMLKNTFCLVRDGQAYLSQHMGDLQQPDCCRRLEQSVGQLQKLLQARPERIACDLHPDFYSTRLGEQLSQANKLPLIRVQHHHAHLVAVMAEHQLHSPVIGLTLDGVGLGTDGRLWGGELLRADRRSMRRLSWLQPMPLPGGDKAVAEPWRMAVALLERLGCPAQAEQRFGSRAGLIRQQLAAGLNCPDTSSCGRLFDVVAVLLGLVEQCSYEAQAAMQLESLAWSYLQQSGWPETDEYYPVDPAGPLDLLPLLARLLEMKDPAYAAAWFHQQLAAVLVDWAEQVCRSEQVDQVILAGGCFLNGLLRQRVADGLQDQGLVVYQPTQLPCNDAAISLGQACVALALAPGEQPDYDWGEQY